MTVSRSTEAQFIKPVLCFCVNPIQSHIQVCDRPGLSVHLIGCHTEFGFHQLMAAVADQQKSHHAPDRGGGSVTSCAAPLPLHHR